MSDPAPSSRFTAPSKATTSERLSTTTVGLVALSDFRKRRAEVLEQQEREAREKSKASTPADAGTPASDGSDAENHDARQQKQSQPPPNKKNKKQKRPRIGGLSFAEEAEDDGGSGCASVVKAKKSSLPSAEIPDAKKPVVVEAAPKLPPNTSVGVVPRALTKAALKREAAEREALRAEFLALQAAVRATEVAIPFVFYDGTNLPGGTVTVKKGDFVWVFLDKSRKVGAKLNVGGDRIINARRDWARVGVDDLIMVRGTIIIPHHYEFYFFAMNKIMGPGNQPLFNFSAEAAAPQAAAGEGTQGGLHTAGQLRSKVDIRTLEGYNDDPNLTKVVDRRWYEKNKHIYPASTWQELDPDKDYRNEIRRDTGGNTFFYSRRP